MKMARLIGSAGSGKTTELMRIMEGAMPGVGGDPRMIGLLSFTRAARQEFAERASAAHNIPVDTLTKEGYIRTGHSLCYRQLGVQAGQMITDCKADIEWLSGEFGVPLRTTLDDDNGNQVYIGDERVSWSLNAWNMHRVTLKPLEEVVRLMAVSDPTDAQDVSEVRTVAYNYESIKRGSDRYDFSDLLLRFAGLSCSPKYGVSHVTPEGDLPPVRAWLFDEQQDASPLLDAVCKRLISGPMVKWCYVVGDPFQCQPAGTPVLTSTGEYKAIEGLDQENDRLIAYSRSEGRFYGTSGAVTFEKAFRDVDSGELFELTLADGTKTTCTGNHRWLVRTFKKPAWATYLMKKGTRWRIGTVQMFAKNPSDKNGDFRLKMRMNQEDAESAWVLRVFGSDREARIHEQIVSCRYGIPQVTFRPPCGCKNNLDSDFIEAVFSELGDLTGNATRCITEHGLDARFPFSEKADRAKNGAKATRFVRAVNLLPGIHVVPKLKQDFFERKKRGSGERRGNRKIGNEAEWVSVVSVKRCEPGKTVRVYSLEVPRHHTYVTKNGVVTGNSIYGFAGSSADCFLGWQADKQRIMPKSYRCPAPILALGEECLRKMTAAGGYFDRHVEPADHDGEILRRDDLEDIGNLVSGNDEWLLIARTNYHASRLLGWCASNGIPAKSVKAPDEPTARQRGMAALYGLENGEMVAGKDWAAAVALLPTKDRTQAEMLTRGTKTRWKKKDEDTERWDAVTLDDMPQIGGTPKLVEQIRSGEWQALVDHGKNWRDAAKKYGVDRAMRPRVRVGTIHSVKGMEADNVAVLTTTSKRVSESAQEEAQHNEECRIAYVAATRARRRLVIVNEGGSRGHRMEALA